ncbi:tail fiber domain-containing protein [Citrobacter braakii]|uniref:tail fiber domain-containing protein n=1 Tax=Citrobacter braakii TaxID=57706 RepID=UPI00242D2BA8|nr:tail fiber domain-containing protein [Citrobacter braakii]WFV19552.1 tail fiber domain-containing protein [Citrobacter braakii]WFV20125.1 tail fiber domain-containing protein [Citrobacter braakii]
MSAGTLTLTNNSAAVSGSGTVFTTELAAGDFIVVTVGGIPYTLPVKTVNSNASLTLVSNFTGPTQSGAAWSAVPRVALNMVTAALVTQSAEALRGLNYDKQNWQLVYSATGTITVKLPDGTSFTGPSWKYLAENVVSKSSSNTFSDENIFTKAGACITLQNTLSNTSYIRFRDATNNVDLAFLGRGTANSDVVSLYGLKGNNSFDLRGDGTNYIRGATTFNAQITADGGMVARGGGATIKTQGSQAAGSYILFEDASGNQYGFIGNPSNTPGALSFYNFSNNNSFELRQDGTNFVRGNTTFNGSVTCVSLTQTSDRDLKEMIEPIEDPLEKISLLTGVTFRWKDNEYPSAGVIAQDVMNVLPEVIACAEDDDGNRHLAVEYSGLVGLCIEAIKAQQKQIESLKALIGGSASGIVNGNDA